MFDLKRKWRNEGIGSARHSSNIFYAEYSTCTVPVSVRWSTVMWGVMNRRMTWQLRGASNRTCARARGSTKNLKRSQKVRLSTISQGPQPKEHNIIATQRATQPFCPLSHSRCLSLSLHHPAENSERRLASASPAQQHPPPPRPRPDLFSARTPPSQLTKCQQLQDKPA